MGESFRRVQQPFCYPQRLKRGDLRRAGELFSAHYHPVVGFLNASRSNHWVNVYDYGEERFARIRYAWREIRVLRLVRRNYQLPFRAVEYDQVPEAFVVVICITYDLIKTLLQMADVFTRFRIINLYLENKRVVRA